MAALRIVFITLLFVGCAHGARAQDQTTSEEPEVIAGEPDPQSFDVFAGNASESTKDRGIIGGGGYYYAVVTIAPRYEISSDGEVRILLGDSRVTKEVIQRQDPGGLAVLNWEFELVEMDYPEGLVRQVTAVFDGETVVSDRQGASVYRFTIPEGSSRLERFMVRWAWGRHDETLVFNARAGGFPAWLGVAALLLLAGAGLLWMRRDDKDKKEKEGERVFIDLEAAYFFPDANAAKKAAKKLEERFAVEALEPLRDDFDEANAALAEAFHKTWRGIDGEGKRTTEGRTFEPETPRADKARERVPEPEFSPF